MKHLGEYIQNCGVDGLILSYILTLPMAISWLHLQLMHIFV